MEEGEWPRYFVGTPAKVRGELEKMASELEIGELIVNTIVWEQAKRLRSYELLARVFDQNALPVTEREGEAIFEVKK
jgi:alkanesulfonate monooxygenase SsuD/methylene tetrahydromethanopterin reductase-like flavin-dependent oxidoreductase (luciferase family)